MANLNGEEQPMAKLTDEIVTKLRLGQITLKEAAELTGASRVACCRARSGDSWRKHPTPPIPTIKRK